MCEFCYRPCCCQRWRRLPVPAEPDLPWPSAAKEPLSPGAFRGEGERVVPRWVEVEESEPAVEPAEA